MKQKAFFGLFTFLFIVISLKTDAQINQFSWDNLPKISEPTFKKDTFNVIKYGAKADGITLNTKAINDAITDCSNKGGGVVFIPRGYWLTGPIKLKSNVNLHLQKNA